MSSRVIVGDALAVLRGLPSESVQMVCTSPPYLGLRSYGTNPQVWGGDSRHAHIWGDEGRSGQRIRHGQGKHGLQDHGQDNRSPYCDEAVTLHPSTGAFCACGAWRGELGSEPTPAMFIEHLVEVFEEVKRVLRRDGLAFVNLGDSYSGSGKGPTGHNGVQNAETRQGFESGYLRANGEMSKGGRKSKTEGTAGIPAKNLLLIPERFAIAMQDDGWIVRSRIAWCKTSAMPESVKDRPTSAWEHIWMFSKSRTYFYDADAVRQPHVDTKVKDGVFLGSGGVNREGYQPNHQGRVALGGTTQGSVTKHREYNPLGASLRNVWLLGPAPSSLEHYASFPPEIPRRCILAGTSEKGACPACGAPWVRVVEREGTYQDRKALGYGGACNFSPNAHNATHAPGTKHDLDSRTRMLGWQSSCSCPPADPVPCVVLDPFLGSGTTAMVADRLGRDAIGIELSPEYARMAEARIQRDAGLLWPEPVTVEEAQQPGLFAEASA